MSKQRYVSPILYHFVGRSADNDDRIFEILLKILEQKVLKFDPNNNLPNSVKTFQDDALKSLGEISNIPAVCFCDIPFTELDIHTNKYSRVGLGFKKDSLLKKGVRPVWYIPKDGYSTIVTTEKVGDRFPKDLKQILGITSTIITKLWEDVDDIISEKNILSNDPEVQKCLSDLNSSHLFLLAEIAWFFKFYDSSLPDDDPNNYYFEREWRKVNADLEFEHKEIEEVLLPSDEFKEQLIEKYPELANKVSILV